VVTLPKTLSQVFDDLSLRFIINIPDEELASFERLCFQVEAAHWFYDDFYREAIPNLPSLSFKDFGKQSKFPHFTRAARCCTTSHTHKA
jgi:hypothetical protein